ncbi:Uncharacterised protein [Clostridioides difficile]|nr:Uncharacterised protein [Clostridioides difficile]
MGKGRSFKEYIKKRFDNEFWAIAEEYLNNTPETIEKLSFNLRRPGDFEITDVCVEHLWIDDKPGMEIHFDVALSVTIEVQEGDYHYDDCDERTFWLMLNCRGDIEKEFADFEILDYEAYSGKNRIENPMDDSLVPYIPYERMEQEAETFLKRNYPDALRVPFRGQAPVWVDSTKLAEKMGLQIQSRRIKADSSVYGQIYFEDTEVELFDNEMGEDIKAHIAGKTILVDPAMYLLRNLGSVNNTIIHECVHWDKHRKAFRLEQIFNDSISCISCEVEGGATSGISKSSTDYMEKQANQLAPRIQMPREPFIAKAKEYITTFMRDMNGAHEVDVMQSVIDTLAIDFGVSR